MDKKTTQMLNLAGVMATLREKVKIYNEGYDLIELGSEMTFTIGKNKEGEYIPVAIMATVFEPVPYFISEFDCETVIGELGTEALDIYFNTFSTPFKPSKNHYSMENLGEIVHSLLSEGPTTTLEVKEKLRDEGFWAVQSQVSKDMKSFARNENLDFNAVLTDGKLHLMYSYI